MSLDWYHGFLAAVFLLWLGAAPIDRNALRIILIASLASEALVDLVTRQMTAPWKLVIPGALEVLTIAAMLRFSRNRTGYWQAALLALAWAAHLLCYFDIAMRTDLVYSRYETIIQMVAVGQLAACYETIVHIAGRVRLWSESCWHGRRRFVRSPSSAAHLLCGKGNNGV